VFGIILKLRHSKSYSCVSYERNYYMNTNQILNVSETARLLDTDNTYIYKLIRKSQLKPVQANPYKVSIECVKQYLDSRLPSSFAVHRKVAI
jgi:hypothetical protein